MKRLALGLFVAAFLSGCSTMTIHPKQQAKLVSKPTYEQTIPFYFWGLHGEERIDVKKVCDGKKPVQMQTQATFENALFTALTIGIYAPHTAKVWCE